MSGDQASEWYTHHLLSPVHELLVDDLASVILPRFDVNRLSSISDERR